MWNFCDWWKRINSSSHLNKLPDMLRLKLYYIMQTDFQLVLLLPSKVTREERSINYKKYYTLFGWDLKISILFSFFGLDYFLWFRNDAFMSKNVIILQGIVKFSDKCLPIVKSSTKKRLLKFSLQRKNAGSRNFISFLIFIFIVFPDHFFIRGGNQLSDQ